MSDSSIVDPAPSVDPLPPHSYNHALSEYMMKLFQSLLTLSTEHEEDAYDVLTLARRNLQQPVGVSEDLCDEASLIVAKLAMAFLHFCTYSLITFGLSI